MLTEEEFYKESIDTNLYYLRTLRDFCINIELSFYGDNPYKGRAALLARESQDLGREIVTLTNGKVPSKGLNYQIFYTEYTLPIERLTEKLFNLNLGTDITEMQLKLTPTDTFEVNDELITILTSFNDRATSIANEFINLAREIRGEMTSNNLFSYSYPTMYNFMIIEIELYIGELNRLKEMIRKDPIIALDTEYGYNITAYEITSFLRGLIDPNATSYIEVLNNILNEIYPQLLEDYNSLPLSPENQKDLTERSIAIIRRIRLLLSNMLRDLLDAKLYFIIEPLAIDNFYRDINYFLYILDADNKEV
ncbi:MAG TPA: DUF2935 domain-containing protein [Candidatus Onthousia excrementipullorum]|uniref:DUF2935 domain-containing protein n=1 Tax=Candidatus Onthousia excrementipullorum TaxID=2840884 RepID=A0A9D1J370_9FIRM|nr:DUF2935 domain-containing protein [Candidatus Onthousia excrementipullorum]